MKLLILGHHSLANRGCEALLRSTVQMIRSRHPKAQFLVPSVQPASDAGQWPQSQDQGVTFVEAPRSTVLLRAWARACERWPAGAAGPWPRVRPPQSWKLETAKCDVALAIGGDNCTLDYGLESLAFHVALAESVQAAGCPVVLWGASIGPFDARSPVGRHMADHLGALQAITLRESLSEEGLQSLWSKTAARGDRPVVKRVADPAFTLEPEPVDIKPYWPKGSGPVLGLNLSPLAIPGDRLVWMDAVASLVRRWCVSPGLRVVLVPHVTARDASGRPVHLLPPHLDDGVLLDQLEDRLYDLAAVSRLPAWNAAQLKHAIGQFDFFLGARTHSVIAALSSGVPAVALAYSLKARGIHRDLLGSESGVLPVRQLTPQVLDAAVQDLVMRAPKERLTLAQRIPHWRTRAREGLEVLSRAA